ncbi:MAG: DUF1465 family protein [Rhodospirillales bacterium]|jgi:hypothetical protein|nr:DUF1465 family protein [Rhodospirillales bacterium]
MVVDLKMHAIIEKEALELAAEARRFLRGSQDRTERDWRDIRLRFLVCERIHWVIAWVLYQKAIQAGETDAATVRKALKGMAGRPPADDPETDERIDPDLRALVDRSGRLFARVQRLLTPHPAPTKGRPREDRVGGCQGPRRFEPIILSS